MIIEQPSLAILIDCWFINNFPHTPSNMAYGNIVDFLDSNEYIKTVVLASYNCRSEAASSRTIWYDNYKGLFHNNIHSRKIRDLEHVHRVYAQQDTRYPNEETHPLILNYTNKDKYQISMQWGWELDYYLSLNPEIKNIYVLGVAWDNCVKVRPLGYESLLENPNINVLTHIDCSANMDGSPVNLDSDLAWYKVKDKIYCVWR